jgi:ssDNA thymidine ADP-ribosyltransferase, DarT
MRLSSGVFTLQVNCHESLYVGGCVPFYFCPRSIMLYLIHCANHEELSYRGGQGPIVHLEADMFNTVTWANQNGRKWAFTLSNAGAYYFESRRDLSQLNEINWDAVSTNRWSGNGISRSVKEGKQAEFLLQQSFPWALVEKIGVMSQAAAQQVVNALRQAHHRPSVEIQRTWYY